MVEIKFNNPNALLIYQWYESNSNSTTNEKVILAVRQSTYTVTNSDVLKTRIKYFYTFISAFVDGNIVNSVVPNIYTIKNKITAYKSKYND